MQKGNSISKGFDLQVLKMFEELNRDSGRIPRSALLPLQLWPVGEV